MQAQAITAPPADPGAACGEPLPYLVNELPSYPADPSKEYAFRVEPFAPVITFARVRGCGGVGVGMGGAAALGCWEVAG